MRSRLAVAVLLATGALFSTTGTALGVSALSTELSAGAAQYGGKTPAAPPAGGQAGGQAGAPAGGNVLGVSQGSPPAEAGGGGEGAVAGESAESGPGAAQPARQTQALEADRLPFTGYAAIPLLLMGIALLASGLVLRRRGHGAPAQL